MRALALLLLASPAFAEGIEVRDPFALSSRPGAPTGAAYMVIQNHGTTDDRLLSAASPVAARVELHRSVEEDGMMSMEPVPEGFAVPAGGELLLERGGAHVMFVGLAEPWEDGALIPLTLTFEGAGAVAVEVPVDLDRLTPTREHGGHGG